MLVTDIGHPCYINDSMVCKASSDIIAIRTRRRYRSVPLYQGEVDFNYSVNVIAADGLTRNWGIRSHGLTKFHLNIPVSAAEKLGILFKIAL